MELIAKISKGTKMDQIYIPKNRPSLSIGEYVKITPVQPQKEESYFIYHLKNIPPLKIELVKRIFKIINSIIAPSNIIITGSFLEKGFNFKDIDIILITETASKIEKKLEEKIKIPVHLITFNKKSFLEALKIDPLWRLMLTECISKKRLTPLPSKKINHKYLDAHLIKSKLLIDNFDYLSGKEKYKLTRNLIAIYLFIKNKKISKTNIEKEIRKKLDIEIEDLKNNLIAKDFFRRYKNFYSKLEKELIENAAKQEKIN